MINLLANPFASQWRIIILDLIYSAHSYKCSRHTHLAFRHHAHLQTRIWECVQYIRRNWFATIIYYMPVGEYACCYLHLYSLWMKYVLACADNWKISYIMFAIWRCGICHTESFHFRCYKTKNYSIERYVNAFESTIS